MGWRYTGLQTGAECGKERGMAFDFKKEYREFYLPKDRPEIVKGYVNDLSETRMHHEIYLSDARRVIPEKWKTVIRHPIRRG